MAKYTELFSEYLESGGELPAYFSQIEGFEELFKLTYCDYEIGFETEELFKLKLERKARINIPLYKKRIDAEVQAFTGALNPTKTYYDSGNTTLNAGKQTGKTSELPINVGGVIEPSSVIENDEYTNTDTHANERKESGTTISEAMLILDKLNEKVRAIVENLLDEFKSCFMGIY